MVRLLALLALWAPVAAAAPSNWHQQLYLGNGGVWRQRIPLVFRNGTDAAFAGRAVSLTVGTDEGEAPLVGARVADVRVCNEAGDEMLFGLTDADRKPLRSGRVPEDAVLIVPVECAAHSEARHYVYFDNQRAWAPPDYLEGSGSLRNGSVEEGSGDTPDGWVHDAGDARHTASWTDEDAHTGRWCLKLQVAEGAEPSWISTRQSEIQITGGARYRMSGWVKASGVKGNAGWYIHLGNLGNPMIDSPMLYAGEGTYDWKQVSLEFTAPYDADRADLGTVLWGTGTAWFDDVKLELLEKAVLPEVRVLPVERLIVQEVGAACPWISVKGAAAQQPVERLPLRLLNLGEKPYEGFCSVAASIAARLYRGRVSGALTLTDRGSVIPHYRLGDMLLFETKVPARSLLTMHAYANQSASRPTAVPAVRAVEYAPNPAVPGGMNRTAVTMEPAQYAVLLSSPRNLVKNPSFESGAPLPSDWPGGAEGERPAGAEMSVVDEGLFGKRCVRLHIPANSTRAWTGWRQEVPVQPNRTYLLAGWLRCEDLEGGLQIHVHFRKENGELVSPSAMTSAGPAISGTTGWTLIAGLFQTPKECRRFQIHLTMLATGTAWHDGIMLLEVAPAEALELETRSSAMPPLAAWSVNPLVKVFREDAPPLAARSGKPAGPIRISCAGNEYEPVQIALRSTRAVSGVQVVVDPPAASSGGSLKEWQIGVVGYVPIDTASNYFNDSTPPYSRKVPRGSPGSDGWPGWWPDPVLPRDRFDLQAGRTQPIWLTLHVPPATRSGEYRGRVRFMAGGKVLASVPLIVRVRSFRLPDRPSLKAIYDCRQSGPMWRIPDQTEEQSRVSFWRFMADHRVCPDMIWPEPVFSYKDGKATADFTDFDRAGHIYFEELKFPHAYTPSQFYLFGWGHLPADKFGEKPYEGEYPYTGVDRSKLRPEYRRAYQACLKVFWDHIKAMGWADRYVLYISDEPYDDQPAIRAQMKALCDMIHEVDPKIPIYCSTWHHQPEWDGKLDVWGLGHYGIVPAAKMEEIKAGGASIWWTTDGQMCTDTPYCAIERLLPHYCFKYGAEAYEFWGVDWLTYDPYRFGWHRFLIHNFGVGAEPVYVRYPNGDGFLAYPPAPVKLDRAVTSLRLEQAREGVEDYEYLVLLRQLVEKGRAEGKDVSRSEGTLRQATDLVTSPCEIGRYSTRILPDPDRVLSIRERVGDEIEKLEGQG